MMSGNGRCNEIEVTTSENGDLAQLVEQMAVNHQVGGSSPSVLAICTKEAKLNLFFCLVFFIWKRSLIDKARGC